MSSENISNISRRATTPYTPGVKKGKDQAAAPKPGEKQPQAPVKDQIDIRGVKPQEEEAPKLVSPEDMARYLKILNDSPDADQDKVQRAKDALERGDYGTDALDKTVDGLLDDLLGI